MSDTPPATTPTKNILQSKTLWVQIIMIALAFFPPALAWLQANPVSTVALIAAVNTIVRFVTSGKVSIFPPEELENLSGGSGGSLPLVAMGLCMAVGSIGFSLSSCTPAQLASAQAMAKAVPVKACYVAPDGTHVCYSSADGVEVDVGSGK